MTVQEALAEGLSVTGVGLAIVFSVLVILMLVMMAMKKIFYKDPAKANKEAPVATPAPADAPVVKAETKVDEGELIAVLTAAIAASLNTSTYNLQIKSYRRIENRKPAWNKAGVSETINSRY
ncbi:MAG: OadG family protein [Eubacteriales bacterium]|nr:OadG family protein [Eubacteriales bacterium]